MSFNGNRGTATVEYLVVSFEAHVCRQSYSAFECNEKGFED